MPAAITIDALNAKFAGWPVMVTHAKDFHGMDQEGICKSFRVHDEKPESGIIIMECENGLEMGFLPETLTENSLVGYTSILKKWVRTITIGQSGCSAKEAFDKKSALEAEARLAWITLVKKLANKIPKSLELFARNHNWCIPEEETLDHIWMLPDVLEQIIRKTKQNEPCYFAIPDDKFREDGFQDSDQLKAKFLELNKAWASIIRLEINEDSQGYTRVYCYAVEFETK